MSQTRRLTLVLSLNLGMLVGLIVAGLSAHSLGLLAGGADFAADSLALALGLVAVHLRDRRGIHRAPTYVAAINASFLLAVTVGVLIAAAGRLLRHQREVHALPVLIVAAISAVVMLTGALILGRGAGSEDLHMRSVLLDTLADALSAATVSTAGGIMYVAGGAYWLDSVVAMLVSILVGFGAIRLLRDVVAAIKSHSTVRLDLS